MLRFSLLSVKYIKSLSFKSQQQQSGGGRKLVASEKAALKEVNRLGKAMWVCVRTAGIIADMKRRIELLSCEEEESNNNSNSGSNPKDSKGQHRPPPLIIS